MAGGLNNPEFFLSINGMNYTPFCTGWQLDDVEDGMSSLRVTLGNPDGILGGYFTTENYITFRYGYWDGRMSRPVVMRIKDMDESYDTDAPPVINLTAYDVTERLLGITHAGNSLKNPKAPSLVESIINGVRAKAEMMLQGPKKMPERVPLHNMTSHAAIRWILGYTKCGKDEISQNNSIAGMGYSDDYRDTSETSVDSSEDVGANPIGNQEAYTAGKEFRAAESFRGDRSGEAQINRDFNEIDRIRVRNRRNRAGNQVITARLELNGHPGVEAKKCVTVLNVGSQASGKWYVTRSLQRWSESAPFTASLNLMRPTLDAKGKPVAQPIVMYAKIYEPNVIFVGCREVDAPSQATVIYGHPMTDGRPMVKRFDWNVKVTRARGSGEGAKTKTWAINQAKKILQAEAVAKGTYRPATPPAPPLDKLG